jgi:hypothetical protein
MPAGAVRDDAGQPVAVIPMGAGILVVAASADPAQDAEFELDGTVLRLGGVGHGALRCNSSMYCS